MIRNIMLALLMTVTLNTSVFASAPTFEDAVKFVLFGDNDIPVGYELSVDQKNCKASLHVNQVMYFGPGTQNFDFNQVVVKGIQVGFLGNDFGLILPSSGKFRTFEGAFEIMAQDGAGDFLGVEDVKRAKSALEFIYTNFCTGKESKF